MDEYSIVQSIAIILIVLGLIRLIPDYPVYYQPCGNKKCKRLKIEKDGNIHQSILEGLECPVCKNNFLNLIKETKNDE